MIRPSDAAQKTGSGFAFGNSASNSVARPLRRVFTAEWVCTKMKEECDGDRARPEHRERLHLVQKIGPDIALASQVGHQKVAKEVDERPHCKRDPVCCWIAQFLDSVFRNDPRLEVSELGLRNRELVESTLQGVIRCLQFAQCFLERLGTSFYLFLKRFVEVFEFPIDRPQPFTGFELSCEIPRDGEA